MSTLNRAKQGKAYAISKDIIIPAMKKVTLNCYTARLSQYVKKFTSNSTVKKRIDEISDNAQNTLKSIIQNSKYLCNLMI